MTEARGKPTGHSGFLASPRTPHLLRLWSELCAIDSLPQVDRWLVQRFRQDKRFGKKDRQWYADAFFAAFRWGLWAWAAERSEQGYVAKDAGQKEEVCLQVGWEELRQLPGERLFHWLSLRRQEGPGEIHGETSCLASWRTAAEQDPIAPNSLLWWGLPPACAAWLHQRQAVSGWSRQQLLTFLQQQGERAPLWLRLNAPHRAESVQKELESHACRWIRDGNALKIEGDVGVLRLESFTQGWFELQDRASQRIGEAIPLRGDEVIWDVCAGGGGKTMQLAARTAGTGGVVVASDIRHYKLADVQLRADRAGLRNIRTLSWNGRDLPPLDRAVQDRGGYDVVLVDAPCSSSGTWRRQADGRFRLSAEECQRLIELQASLLTRMAPVVRSGGFLVYATCSWLVSENEAQVEAFLQQHPVYTLHKQELLGCPAEDADTMFVAVMCKGASPRILDRETRSSVLLSTELGSPHGNPAGDQT